MGMTTVTLNGLSRPLLLATTRIRLLSQVFLMIVMSTGAAMLLVVT